MKILLLCDRASGGADNGAPVGDLRGALIDLLTDAGHEVETVTLNWENTKPCVGCFGCWLKTPGKCVISNDGANETAAAHIRSGAIVALTEITFGGFSADIKSYLDRSIQNIAADFEVYKGEMRHKMRYDSFPIWAAVGYGDVSDAERRTFAELAQRNSLNMRPKDFLALTVNENAPIDEAGRAILKLLEASA